ncbi:MAG: 3-phosphoshikimate 1-carboxyvinyltransferase [Gemmatimonadetes bacterium]|nr:3-phosphoshikimate 1-carboxyvinyltransferase [Gemmatimonadota bacterium]
MISFRLPGDKSIAHRAVLFAPLAGSDSTVANLPGGEDVRSSIRVMEGLGAKFSLDDGETGGTIRGGCRLRSPVGTLDCGNAGTTARLVSGILTGLGLKARLDGDASLRTRPMRRVFYPLQAMGARLDLPGGAYTLPVQFRPRATGSLRTLVHRPRVASAQVKSALLLAGLTGGIRVEVKEPALSRDHTERMLGAMGAPVDFDPDRRGEGRVILDPSGWDGELAGFTLDIPGDPSSAAFLIVAGILARRSVHLADVSANPGRTAFLDLVEQTGTTVEREVHPPRAGEPVQSWTVKPPDRVRPFSVGGADIPRLIDELPAAAVLAAVADGVSEIRDAAELRVKETDRIAAIAANLEALGVEVDERVDGISVRGRAPGTPNRLAGAVRAFGDHRIAMAFGALGLVTGAGIEVDDPKVADISFPGYWKELKRFKG